MRNDIKDLNPQDQKKRKEPPKPWGKKERILVLTVLLTTVMTSVFLALSARDWKPPGLPKISFPSFDFFKGETIVIEKRGNKNKDAEIISSFNNETKGLSGTYGLYVIRLNDGSSYGTHGNETFEAASLIKLPVMTTLFLEKPAGYKDLTVAMGNRSDNAAFIKAKKILGDARINEVIEKIGMRATSLQENQTTPEEIGLFFKKLYQRDLLPEDETNEFLESITNTIFENWLVAGIPEEVRVAHKYGREIHVVNDAGIVFAKNPFVLVIMSKGVVEAEADKIFPELARLIYVAEVEK